MNKLIAFFIKYTVPVNIITIAIVVFGIIGMMNMRSSFFPIVETDVIRITAAYPGASASEIEEGIVLKIEEAIKGISGVTRISSSSSENFGSIRVEVDRDYDIDVVLQDVNNYVNSVSSFPSGMYPPTVSKGSNLQSAIFFTLSGDGISLKSLKDIARNIESDLLNTDGISNVSLQGFPNQEIEIAVRESDLRAYNLTFHDVSNAVSKNNVISSGGNIKTQSENYLIRANVKKYRDFELENLVVKSDGNSVVYLKDVAQVEFKWEDDPSRVFRGKDNSIYIEVHSTPSENLIEVCDSVKEYMTKFNKKNDNIKTEIFADFSKTLDERTQLLMKNGVTGILLVILLLAIFLTPRLAFWVAFGLPISMIGLFIVADMAGVTINILSLFGMIMVIGILVDDAIVISENIYEHSQRGKTKIQAAIDGTKEVLPAIVSAILTTIIAFSTFFFLDGKIGNFFGEVSTVVIITLLISLVEALIILPSHMAHSKALDKNQKRFKVNIYADKFMDWMISEIYLPSLKFFLKHRFISFVIPIAVFVITIGAMKGGVVKMTFFPQLASDRIQIILKMPFGTHEDITKKIISDIENKIALVDEKFVKDNNLEKPLVENTLKILNGSEQAMLFIKLVSSEQRDITSKEISNAIEKKVGDIPQARSLVFDSATNFGGSPVTISLMGNDKLELKSAKKELKQILKKNPEIINLRDDDPKGIKEINLKLKEKAYLLGFSYRDVISQVRSGFYGVTSQIMQIGRDEVKIKVRYDKDTRSSIKSLDNMRLSSPRGQKVSLSEIASYEIERGEVKISHLNGKRTITIRSDLKTNDKASEILGDIKNNIVPKLISKYPSVSAIYEGQNRASNEIASSAKVVVPIILFLIYLVIGFTFRSYSQPALFFPMIIFSLSGVIWGHWVHDFAVNILSLLGIIALIGVLVNDGLVFIGKFNSNIGSGMKYDEALIGAGKSRFRAIFLTTITTTAGLLPLIFERSFQAQFLKPMAISIAYGILFSTFLTLVYLPTLLSLTNSFKVFLKRLFSKEKVSREEVERAYKETHL